MPELPDVELEKRYLDHTALSRRIVKTHLEAPKLLYHTTPQALYQNLSGHRLTDSQRHGKHLFVGLDQGRWLVLHFGMTGSLVYQKSGQPMPDYAALLLELDNDYCLSYISRRKLGRIGIAASPAEVIEREQLGPDALALSGEAFVSRLREGRGRLKSWLMNQAHLAGLGNIYTDEILYQAGLHPKRQLKSLSEDELNRLYSTMRQVLTAAIDHKADPGSMPRSWLLPYRDQRAFDCPHCGEAVKTVKINGRTTYYCPRCQH